jgi:hypothetical protein
MSAVNGLSAAIAETTLVTEVLSICGHCWPGCLPRAAAQGLLLVHCEASLGRRAHAVAVRPLENSGRFAGNRFDLGSDELTASSAVITKLVELGYLQPKARHRARAIEKAIGSLRSNLIRAGIVLGR